MSVLQLIIQMQSDKNPALDKAILDCKLNRLAHIESQYTWLNEPGIYCNIHHPYYTVRVTVAKSNNRGNNIQDSGYVEPVAWGIASEHWRPASLKETVFHYKNEMRFARRRLQYKLIQKLIDLYQSIRKLFD